MAEEWRDIPGWEGKYQASSEGRIRSVDRDSVRLRHGRPHTRVMRGRVLTPSISNSGYGYCAFYDPSRFGGKRARVYVHRAVCAAFHGEAPDESPWVAHADGDRRNNRPQNLRWASVSENSMDRFGHGTVPLGEHHVNAILKDHDIRRMKEMLGNGHDRGEVAAEFGVSRKYVGDVARGVVWKHINI